jgi:hypothetical protein
MCNFISYIIREEYRLTVFGNRLLRRLFGPRREKWQEAVEYCKIRSFVILSLPQILLG